MWAIAQRRVRIVLLALAIMGCSCLHAQENKSQNPAKTPDTDTPKKDQAKEPPAKFWETDSGVGTQFAGLMICTGEPLGILAVRVMAPEHPLMKTWKFPLPVQFWLLDRGLEIQASASVFGARNAWGLLGARMVLSHEDFPLPSWHFKFDEMLPLSFDDLARVTDDRPIPVRLQNELTGPDRAWYNLFNEALRRSKDADLAMFKKSAEKDDVADKHYSHLRGMPDQFRGKIITVKGKLILIRKEDSPRQVNLEEIPHIYTGYIIGPTQNAPPFAVAFTDLPEGVEKPSESLDLEVTFHGYFISFVRFPPEKKGGRRQEDIISPYLVGKTVILNGERKKNGAEEKAEHSYTYYVVLASLGGIFTVGILVAMLNIWFRRGDRRIQAQLTAMRERDRPFMLEPADEPPATTEGIAAGPPTTPETAAKPAESPGEAQPPAE